PQLAQPLEASVDLDPTKLWIRLDHLLKMRERLTEVTCALQSLSELEIKRNHLTLRNAFNVQAGLELIDRFGRLTLLLITQSRQSVAERLLILGAHGRPKFGNRIVE